jgi:S1-C subfamily serine protease
MGSDEYDQMLYDSGEPNRVSMKWMTPNSAGTAAGIRPGDLLLTYDGIPIYNEDGVRWRNNLAEPGQSIRVEFIRNGEIYAAEIVRDAQPASMGGSVNGIRFKKEYVEPHLGQ